MKVGLIGLGRMGEGMSRRMMKAGIEVWGYRRNYDKAQEAYESGYVSGVTTTIENLVKVVKQNKNGGTQPGIFQMVVPAETVEETINELLRYCGEGDIIIDHGNSNFKDSRKRAERLAKVGIQYIDCGTSGGVYGLDRGYCLMVGGGDTAVATCSKIFSALSPDIHSCHRTDPTSDVTSAEYGWLHCGGPGAGHFVKMVHNGIEYGIMLKDSILLKMQMQVLNMSEKETQRLPQWQTQNLIAMILMLLRWLSYGVAVVWLAVGYSILLLMCYAGMVALNSSLEAYPTAVRVVGLFLPLWTWGFPLLLLLQHYLKDLTHAISDHSEQRS
jgi:6-phosphogluconate dehydrogenase (decarboxylating)